MLIDGTDMLHGTEVLVVIKAGSNLFIYLLRRRSNTMNLSGIEKPQ